MSKAILAVVLSDHGRDAVKFCAGLGLAVMLALAFAVSSLTSFPGDSALGAMPTTAARADIPPEQLPVMQTAAATCGLPWSVLAAIAKVESDFGRNMATSSAGAIGYGQFLPSSWAAYGRGGDPYDFRDALPAMARYLCDHGAPSDLHAAIFAYNHANWYVDEVMTIAARYATTTVATSPIAAQVVELARSQVGTPYVWGGSTPNPGFDCSGLVQWIYRQLGIDLSRTAAEQYAATIRISNDQLQPGDLVFFANTYPSPQPITHVGIYVGGGQMINAPQEGDVVREMPVFAGYWLAHYAGAGRIRSTP